MKRVPSSGSGLVNPGVGRMGGGDVAARTRLGGLGADGALKGWLLRWEGQAEKVVVPQQRLRDS